MRRNSALAACLIITVLIVGAGCVTDDPNAGGFFGGVVGLSQGTYEHNLDLRRQALRDAQRDAGAVEEKHRAYITQRDNAAREAQVMEAKQREFNAMIEASRREVAALTAHTAAMEQKRVEALAALDRLKEDEKILRQSALSVVEKERELERLLKQQQEILKALRAYYGIQVR